MDADIKIEVIGSDGNLKRIIPYRPSDTPEDEEERERLTILHVENVLVLVKKTCGTRIKYPCWDTQHCDYSIHIDIYYPGDNEDIKKIALNCARKAAIKAAIAALPYALVGDWGNAISVASTVFSIEFQDCLSDDIEGTVRYEFIEEKNCN